MNALVCWIARKRFETERRNAEKAWLLAKGLKARAARLAAEKGNTPVVVKL